RNGARWQFTDALFPLSRTLEAPANQPIYVIDWGMQYSLDLLHHGRLRLIEASGPFVSDAPAEKQRQIGERMIADPNGIFLSHVNGTEAFEGVDRRADAQAQLLGYRRELVEVVKDSNGRPVFELFHYVRASTK